MVVKLLLKVQSEITQNDKSITGKYLSSRLKINVPSKRRLAKMEDF